MTSDPKHIRIGTRGSPLALHQAEQVRDTLEAATSGALKAEIIPYTTSGDRLTTERLITAGGKGLFTKEIDKALEEGVIDLAVHSLKDVPSELPPGQGLMAFLPREDAREGFICSSVKSLEDLPEGAVLGTASIRREAQTRLVRPDLTIIPFRGNVQTRLKKLDAGEADATYLAMAGLTRLGLQHLAHPIPLEDMLPAPCQGIVAVAAYIERTDPALISALGTINNIASEQAAAAERGFLSALDGSCRTPIAAHLFQDDGIFRFVGEVTHPEGTAVWETAVYCALDADQEELAAVGRSAAEALVEQAGGALPQFDEGA